MSAALIPTAALEAPREAAALLAAAVVAQAAALQVREVRRVQEAPAAARAHPAPVAAAPALIHRALPQARLKNEVFLV